jgi:hypothetical protein
MTKRSNNCDPCKYLIDGECLKEEVDTLGWCPEFVNHYISRTLTGKDDDG